jgi:hypothetical protein
MVGLYRIPGEPRGGYGKPVRLGIYHKSRYMQLWLMQNPWIHPFIIFVFSTCKIQKVARGYMVRKHGSLSRYLMWRKSMSKRQKDKINARAAMGVTSGKSPQLDRYLAFLDKAGEGAIARPAWLDGGYSVWCVVRLQSWYRMTKPRRHHIYRKQIINQIAAMIIQAQWKEKLTRMRNDVLRREAAKIAKIPPYRASVRIQLAWRSFCNRRIYAYYRDLVMNKLQGAPQDLLKTIVPHESELLDRAAGALVRFRLGGSIFPPKVFFKVYTHRGVCDVNAFAPRVYAKEKMVNAFQQNIKSEFIPKDRKKYNTGIRVGATYFGTKVKSNTSTDEWYKREENNDWRPIASQSFEEILTPPWLRESMTKKEAEPFHFSRLKRKIDIQKARKRRRRMWLMKAYRLAGADLADLPSQGDSTSTINGDGDVGGGEPLVATTIRRAGEHHDLLYNHTSSSQEIAMATPAQLATIYSPVESPAISRNQTPDRRNRRPASRGFDQYQDNAEGRSRTYSGALGLGTNQGGDDVGQAVPMGQRQSDARGGGFGGGGGGGGNGSVSGEGGDHDSVSESLAFLSMSGAEHESRSLELDRDDAQLERFARLMEGANGSRKDPIMLPSASLAQTEMRQKGADAGTGLQNGDPTRLPPIKGLVGLSGAGAGAGASAKSRGQSVRAAVESKMKAIEGDEDLLNWSMALDYDEYSKGWSTIATSMPSSCRPAVLYNP